MMLLLVGIVVFSSIQESHADNRALLFSAAVPGLGHLSNAQPKKGLFYMGTGVVVLHVYLQQLGLYINYCDETAVLQEQFSSREGADYASRMAIKEQWEENFESAEKVEKLLMPLLATYGVVWAVSLLDLYLFPAEAQEEIQEEVAHPSTIKYIMTLHDNTPHMQLQVSF